MRPYTYLLVFATAGFAVVGTASAYELDTHASMTNASFRQSVLSDATIRRQLDIHNVADSFGEKYFEIAGDSVVERKRFITTEKHMDGASPLSIAGWLARGAVREDDFPSISIPALACFESGNDPDQAGISRPLNHFYDPVNHRPLQPSFGPTERAPDWALGTSDVFSDPNSVNPSRRNHFSMADVRESIFRATTGRTKDDVVVAETKKDRDAYWAGAFRSLGDVLHLIQDMAQPQHTRNDRHAGICGDNALFGHQSVYESYINSAVLGTDFTLPGGGKVRADRSRFFSSYVLPAFNDYHSFFSTRHQLVGVTQRLGIADYSNRSFFSAGTNMRLLGGYAYPTTNNFAYTKEQLTVDWLGEPLGEYWGNLELWKLDVPDPLTGTVEPGVPLTTRSVFDQFLEQRGILPSFSLNRYNYDAMAKLLIPRAVGYGAGLINHLLRGQLTISPPDEGVYSIVDHSAVNKKDIDGFKLVKLKLKNSTKDIFEGVQRYQQDMTGGTIRAVAKFRRNTCYLPTLGGEFRDDPNVLPQTTWNGCNGDNYRSVDEEIVVSKAIPDFSLSADPDAKPVPLTFEFDKVIPINATDLKLQIVFRGKLGAETDAVVVGTVDLREPTFFSIINGTDYYMVDRQFYTYEQIFASQTLYDRATAGPGSEIIDALDLENLEFWVKPEKKVFKVPHLEPGRFFRVAILSDTPSTRLTYSGQGYLHKQYVEGVKNLGYTVVNAIEDVKGKVNQTEYLVAGNNTETPYPVVSGVDKFRGAYQWSSRYFFQHNEGVFAEIPDDLVKDLIKAMLDFPNASPKAVEILFK